MAEAANPLDATYYANLAALNFQKETTLAQDKRGREQTNASSRFAKGELTRAAPLRYAGNRNQANSQGLLESGQLAQKQGQTQADFANKQARVGEQRKSAIERYNEGDANANKAYDVGNSKAQAESFQRSKEELERNPPAAAAGGGYPIPQAQQEAINRGVQPGAGGVVPYESGKVRVGMPPKAQRAAAARKAAGTPKSQARGWGVG
jgi:hypothetical protein